MRWSELVGLRRGKVALRVEGPIETATSPETFTELLASLREALTNVGRHAAASGVEIEIKADHLLVLRVPFNGRGAADGFDIRRGMGREAWRSGRDASAAAAR